MIANGGQPEKIGVRYIGGSAARQLEGFGVVKRGERVELPAAVALALLEGATWERAGDDAEPDEVNETDD